MLVTYHRLGDICQFTKGLYPTLKTQPGEYPLVVTAAYRRSASTYQLEGPAVCIPLISSTGHGDAALHRVHYQEGPFALADLLVALTPLSENIYDSKYLYHLLMAKKDRLLVPLMQGTANVSLKINDIASVEIPLPPLEEQRRIVAYIDAIAEQLAQARGLRKGAVEDAEGFVVSLHMTLSKDTVMLGEIMTLDEQTEQLEGSKIYPQAGLYSFGRGLFFRGNIKGDQTKYTHFNKLYENAVVLSQLFGWEGALAVCNPDFDAFYVSKEFRTFRCDLSQVNPRYLARLFQTKWFWSKLQGLTTGIGDRRQRIKPDQFLGLRLSIPRLNDQNWAVEIFEYIENYMDQNQKILPELDALLPSLLDRAFKGEL